jgi:hypothetical protein
MNSPAIQGLAVEHFNDITGRRPRADGNVPERRRYAGNLIPN